jgi:hypothetical protein
MPGYFPQHTVDHQPFDSKAARRLRQSVVEMAIITGVTVRLLHALVLTHGPVSSGLYLGGMLVVATVMLLGMLAVHLSNFTLRRWWWRAPAFAAIEATAELAVSALLIAVHREPMGTQRAEFHDWPGIAVQLFWTRLIMVCGFALILAGVVTMVRRILLGRTRDRASRASLEKELDRETPG